MNTDDLTWDSDTSDTCRKHEQIQAEDAFSSCQKARWSKMNCPKVILQNELMVGSKRKSVLIWLSCGEGKTKQSENLNGKVTNPELEEE